jgi:hypothetical protein
MPQTNVEVPANGAVVYPTLVSTTINLNCNVTDKCKVVVKVYDEAGNEIQTLMNETKGKGAFNQAFTLANYRDGIYFVRVDIGDQESSQKIIVSQ